MFIWQRSDNHRKTNYAVMKFIIMKVLSW